MRDTRPAEKPLIYNGLRVLRECGTFSRHTLYIGFMRVAYLKQTMCICACAYEKYKRFPQFPQSRKRFESVDLQGFAVRDFRKTGSRRSRRKEIFMSYKEEIMQIIPAPGDVFCWFYRADKETKVRVRPICVALVKVTEENDSRTEIRFFIADAYGKPFDASKADRFLGVTPKININDYWPMNATEKLQVEEIELWNGNDSPLWTGGDPQ